MCGIFGIWQRDGQPVDLAAVRQATALLRHRGPDDEGYLLADTRGGSAIACAGDDTDPRLGLPHIAPTRASQPCDLAFGFRRLAILDLSPAGHQPMSSPDGRFWLIFNGEVYNYLELREELRGFGHGFRSGSDSEVILAAYAQWGPECLARFNGMWALAIWDRVERSLFLARDRFGVKPLYYAADGSAFASPRRSRRWWAGTGWRSGRAQRQSTTIWPARCCPARRTAKPSSRACGRCRRGDG